MNKIILTEDNIECTDLKNISYTYETDYINKLKINILKNTQLELYINNFNDIKLDIEIHLKNDVKFNLIEIKKNINGKILNKYFVLENSILNITKINDVKTINEKNIINLNEKDASCNLILKTVSKEIEKYDLLINHNALYTNSNIITNGLNINGKLTFMVTTLIPNGMKNSIASQQNKIINLTNNECTIKPNLLIEENDVVANHSALIGTFSPDEIFYMQRMGIDKTTCYKLLTEGFLKSNINKKYSNILKKYWR